MISELRPESHSRVSGGVVLRFFEDSQHKYTVQVIHNPGIHDRRLRPEKRERRVILGRGMPRPEAVAIFNETLERLDADAVAGAVRFLSADISAAEPQDPCTECIGFAGMYMPVLL